MLTQLVIRTQLIMRQHHLIFLQELFQLYPRRDHSMLIMTKAQQDLFQQSKIMDNHSAKSTWIVLLTLKHQECMQLMKLKMRKQKLLPKKTIMLRRMPLKLMPMLLLLKLNHSNHSRLNSMLIKLRLNRIYISQSQVFISTQRKMQLHLM